METATQPKSKSLGTANLKNIELLSGISEDVLSRIAEGISIKKYSKDKILFLQDDIAENLYVIQSGWVKIFNDTFSGDEAIIDILTSGHVFCETAIFNDGVCSYGAEIIEDAELLLIPVSLLKEEIESNNKLALNMLYHLSENKKVKEREIEHLTIQNAPQRIGCFLLRLCNQSDSSAELHLPYDKNLIAARLGMRPETFSRALAILYKEAVISSSGSTIIIDDIAKLSSYCCGHCSGIFPCED